jgi:hypothetical protein
MKWLLALMLSATAFADTSAPAPNARPNPANGVILTAEQARTCAYDTHESFVTPSVADVKRLEAGLAAALSKLTGSSAAQVLKRLDTDVRFYLGTSDGIIAVHGFCKDIAYHREGSCPPMVKDGGSCIWRIRFDTKRGTFDKFNTNGTA